MGGSLLFRGLTLSRYMRHQGGIQGLNRGGRGLGGAGVRNCPNQLKNTLLFQFMDEIICTDTVISQWIFKNLSISIFRYDVLPILETIRGGGGRVTE